jgi:hypothetical protein
LDRFLWAPSPGLFPAQLLRRSGVSCFRLFVFSSRSSTSLLEGRPGWLGVRGSPRDHPWTSRGGFVGWETSPHSSPRSGFAEYCVLRLPCLELDASIRPIRRGTFRRLLRHIILVTVFRRDPAGHCHPRAGATVRFQLSRRTVRRVQHRLCVSLHTTSTPAPSADQKRWPRSLRPRGMLWLLLYALGAASRAGGRGFRATICPGSGPRPGAIRLECA